MLKKNMPSRALAAVATLALAGLLAACTGPDRTADRHVQRGDPGTRAAVLDFRKCAKPVYPREELQAGHEGVVKLGFLVTTGGAVADTKLIASSGFPALDEAARTALASCPFMPALRDGQAVEAWTTIQYVWTRK